MTTSCHREDDLLDALQRGFVGSELEVHVKSCAACSELHLVAGALIDDRVETIAAAPVPSAGTMWWRIQARQRQEAQAKAQRSLLVGQALTVAMAVILFGSLFGAELALGVREVVAAVRLSAPLLLVITMWMIVVPLAGYVAIRQK